MAQFINHNSALLLLLLAFGGMVVLFAWPYRRNLRVLAIIAAVVAVLFAGYWNVRTGPSTVPDIAGVDVMIGAGAPVLVEVYSDF